MCPTGSEDGEGVPFIPYVRYLERMRGKQGRDYAIDIVNYIGTHQNETEYGVRRSHVVNALTRKKASDQKVPHKTQIAREVAKLIEAGIVIRTAVTEPSPRASRQKKEKENVYYQIDFLKTVQNTIISAEMARLKKENFDLFRELFFAKTVLRRHGLYSEWEQDLKDWDSGEGIYAES